MQPLSFCIFYLMLWSTEQGEWKFCTYSYLLGDSGHYMLFPGKKHWMSIRMHFKRCLSNMREPVLIHRINHTICFINNLQEKKEPIKTLKHNKSPCMYYLKRSCNNTVQFYQEAQMSESESLCLLNVINKSSWRAHNDVSQTAECRQSVGNNIQKINKYNH